MFNRWRISGCLSRMRNLLRHRMAYGAVIPPDARVSPDEFSDDEFPVYCPGCNYLLRGLSSNCCPECGRAFERGRLLVAQYVVEQGKHYCKRTSKYARWTALVGFGLLGLLVICDWIMKTSLPAIASASPSGFENVFRLMRAEVAAGILAAALLLASCVLSIRVAFVANSKGKQVFAAIDKTRPTYVKAQRHTWILWVLWLVAFAGVVTWDRDGRNVRGWAAYYLAQPLWALAPIAMAIVVVAVCWLGSYVLNRNKK